MKIIFVVNTCGITGGIKTVFQLANGLLDWGHKAEIIHLLRLKPGLIGLLVAILKKIKHTILSLLKQDNIKWFPLDKRVSVKRLISLRSVAKSSILVATANETACWVDKAATATGKYYLIQAYEDWTRARELVDATYKLPLTKIVTSQKLQGLFKERFDIKIEHRVPCGINISDFDCKDKSYNKNPVILLNYHCLPIKGFDLAYEAILNAQNVFPEIKPVVFGAYPLPIGMKGKFEYYYKPDKSRLKELYCQADIFIFPSLKEGFGIPPMEAMAAACAVIASDTGAVREYAIDGESIILVPPGESRAISRALIGLLKNRNRIKDLGGRAKGLIRKYDIKNSVNEFIKIIRSEDDRER